MFLLPKPLTSSQVDPTKLPCLAQWKREYTMETILVELRRYAVLYYPTVKIAKLNIPRYMALPQHKKLPQPPEGSNF